ncbi:GD12619 [Drosophila simulans]|uniref:GD12619 n=1 Tax=Drosophila simulans TaxID=7240 RepID=B4QJZ9_DROSI|nr:GD12619 [Drosophila simulans]
MASTPKENGTTAKTATINDDYITVVEVDDPTSNSKDRLKKLVKRQSSVAEDSSFITVLTINEMELLQQRQQEKEVGSGSSPTMEEQIENVTVFRLPGERLGFGLKFQGGTRSTELVQKLYIQSCAADSPASKVATSWGNLREGDEIVSIDGRDVRELTRIDCVRGLKDNVAIQLVVRNGHGQKPPSEEDPQLQEQLSITLNAQPPPPPPVPPRKLVRRQNSKENQAQLLIEKPLTPPPDAEYYLNLLTESIKAGSESDDTASTISTVIDKFSVGSNYSSDSSLNGHELAKVLQPFTLLEQEFLPLEQPLGHPKLLIPGNNYENVEFKTEKVNVYENVELRSPETTPTPKPRVQLATVEPKKRSIIPMPRKIPTPTKLPIEVTPPRVPILEEPKTPTNNKRVESQTPLQRANSAEAPERTFIPVLLNGNSKSSNSLESVSSIGSSSSGNSGRSPKGPKPKPPERVQSLQKTQIPKLQALPTTPPQQIPKLSMQTFKQSPPTPRSTPVGTPSPTSNREIRFKIQTYESKTQDEDKLPSLFDLVHSQENDKDKDRDSDSLKTHNSITALLAAAAAEAADLSRESPPPLVVGKCMKIVDDTNTTTCYSSSSSGEEDEDDLDASNREYICEDGEKLGPPELINGPGPSEAYFNMFWHSNMLPTIGEVEEEFSSLEPQSLTNGNLVKSEESKKLPKMEVNAGGLAQLTDDKIADHDASATRADSRNEVTTNQTQEISSSSSSSVRSQKTTTTTRVTTTKTSSSSSSSSCSSTVIPDIAFKLQPYEERDDILSEPITTIHEERRVLSEQKTLSESRTRDALTGEEQLVTSANSKSSSARFKKISSNDNLLDLGDEQDMQEQPLTATITQESSLRERLECPQDNQSIERGTLTLSERGKQLSEKEGITTYTECETSEKESYLEGQQVLNAEGSCVSQDENSDLPTYEREVSETLTIVNDGEKQVTKKLEQNKEIAGKKGAKLLKKTDEERRLEQEAQKLIESYQKVKKEAEKLYKLELADDDQGFDLSAFEQVEEEDKPEVSEEIQEVQDSQPVKVDIQIVEEVKTPNQVMEEVKVEDVKKEIKETVQVSQQEIKKEVKVSHQETKETLKSEEKEESNVLKEVKEEVKVSHQDLGEQIQEIEAVKVVHKEVKVIKESAKVTTTTSHKQETKEVMISKEGVRKKDSALPAVSTTKVEIISPPLEDDLGYVLHKHIIIPQEKVKTAPTPLPKPKPKPPVPTNKPKMPVILTKPKSAPPPVPSKRSELSGSGGKPTPTQRRGSLETAQPPKPLERIIVGVEQRDEPEKPQPIINLASVDLPNVSPNSKQATVETTPVVEMPPDELQFESHQLPDDGEKEKDLHQESNDLLSGSSSSSVTTPITTPILVSATSSMDSVQSVIEVVNGLPIISNQQTDDDDIDEVAAYDDGMHLEAEGAKDVRPVQEVTTLTLDREHESGE